MTSRTSTTLDTNGLAALRRAAVMAHAVGGISLRLSSGGAGIVEVRPDWCGRSAIGPCRFRVDVARAWADHRSGREIGLIGLGATDRLDIEWSIAPPGRDLGLGAVRIACGGRLVWAFASLLDAEALSGVLAGLEVGAAPDGAPAPDGIAAHLVHDELLGATVVHVEVGPTVSTRVLDEVLRRMVARVGAAELTEPPMAV